LGTLPRVVGPGETVQLPVNVFAMEKHIKNVEVEIQVNEMFIPKNGTKKKLSFTKIGDEVINFELNIPEKLGVGKVKIIARSGNEIARHEIEIDVRASNPRVTDFTEEIIEPGKEWTPSIAVDGLIGTNKLTLEVSSIPPINLGERLKYLIAYPHGCIEQTTSAVFPQLYLQNIMELDKNFKAEISENVNEALKRYQLFQTSEGGFSYWPGQSEVSEWGSNYAGHFMLEAEKAGYRVPSDMKSKWIKYQQKMARNWRMEQKTTSYGYQYYDDLTQAYRLYSLALAKSPEIGAMNRMRESSKLSLAARWRLAAAYQMADQPEVASKMIVGASTDIPEYVELSYTFGNDVRDKAMILEALALMNQKAKAAKLMKEIANELNSNKWMSTQTTAYCLIAVSQYLTTSTTSKTMKFTYAMNGAAAVSKSTQTPIFTNSWNDKQTGKNAKFSVKNTGAGTLFVRVIKEGIPLTGDQKSVSSVVDVTVDYYNMDGGSIDVSSLEQGTDFIAEVTITNNGTRGYLSEMALTQIFPSGWEVHNQRMDETRSTVTSDYPTYQDIRDDRVYTYYNIASAGKKVFRFKLNASYLGKFYLPTISTEAMYDNSIQSRKPGRWVEVVKPGGNTASK
jgi:alpha-2-macroglobulin